MVMILLVIRWQRYIWVKVIVFVSVIAFFTHNMKEVMRQIFTLVLSKFELFQI